MINLQWLQDRLCEVLRWQLANPGRTGGGPEVPWAGKRLWSIFLALDATRGSNGWGPNPISFTEIEAWSRLNREPVRPWEVTILRAMDAAYMTVSHGQQSAPQVHRSSAAFAPQVFDAVFG